MAFIERWVIGIRDRQDLEAGMREMLRRLRRAAEQGSATHARR